jgi:hypothetical protein
MPEKHPPATRKDHEKFCVTEGWTERKRATGKRGSHHVNYEFVLPNGDVLFTRISHPVNRDTYGASMWSHILRDQLQVTAAEFWSCVTDGVIPSRGAPTTPEDPIPISIIRTLIVEARIPESEVRAMTKTEAVERLTRFYTTGE